MQHTIWHAGIWHVSCSMFPGEGVMPFARDFQSNTELSCLVCFFLIGVCSMVEVCFYGDWGKISWQMYVADFINKQKRWIAFFSRVEEVGFSFVISCLLQRGPLRTEPLRIVTFDWRPWLLGGGLYASLKPSLFPPPSNQPWRDGFCIFTSLVLIWTVEALNLSTPGERKPPEDS